MVSGGPMRTGNLDGDILDFNSIMESVGSFKNGDIDEEQLEDVAERCCPGCGSCSGLFTANSMNSLTEVLGRGPSVQRNSPLRQRRENPSGEESRHPSYGNAEKRYPSPRYSHKRSL